MRHYGKLLVLLATVCGLLTASPARAVVNDTTGFSVGPNIGTLGYGLEVGYRVSQYWGVRASMDTFTDNRTSRLGGNFYKIRTSLDSEGLVADYYPFRGGWHLVGGARLQSNTGHIRTAGNVTINGTDYGNAAVSGKVAYQNKVAPYVGLGYVGTLMGSWQLSGDLGAMFQGKARVALANDDGTLSPDDFHKIVQQINHSANYFQVYPVLQVALSYHF